MRYTSQRTIYGVELGLMQLLGKEYEIKDNTSLNHLLDINPKEVVPSGEYPKLQYYCLGTGGASFVDNGVSYPYSNHSPLDAGLFQMIPLVLRETNNDLSSLEASKYRLKKTINVLGKDYYAYYLRKIDPDTEIDIKKNFYQIVKRGTGDTLDPVNLNVKDVLRPTPISKVDKVISNNSSYIIAVAKIVINLSTKELEDIKNAIDIINPGFSITEIGLVTGIEKIFPSGNTDAICTQIAMHVAMDIDLSIYLNNNDSLYKTIDVGGTEPMLLG